MARGVSTLEILRIPLLVPCLSLLGLTALAQDESPPEARNLVLILMDDVGYGDLGCQGSESVTTPHLDSLAGQGVRFTRAYVTAGTCSPSRAGLLTGRYQQMFGHEFNPPHQFRKQAGLPSSERTLAAHLKAADFRTAAVGKWHLGYGPPSHPLSHGFEEFFGFLAGARSYYPYKEEASNKMNRLLLGRDPIPEEFDYLTTELGEKAADFIRRNQQERFFLYLSFSAVHTPLQADPELEASQGGSVSPARATLLNMIASMDLAVGKVLSTLEEVGLDETTMIIALSDNGGGIKGSADNGGLPGGKGGLSEGGVRVPFLLRWQQRLKGQSVYGENISALDVVPTALAALGVEPRQAELDGVNLLPYLEGPRSGPPHVSLHWRQGERWAVLRGDHKIESDGEAATYTDLAAPRPVAQDLREWRAGGAERGQLVDDLLRAQSDWASRLRKPKWRKYTLEDVGENPPPPQDGGG